MKDKIKKIDKFIIIMIVFFTLSSVINYILGLFNVNIRSFSFTDLTLYDTLIEGVLLLVVYLVYNEYFKKDLFKLKGDHNLRNNLIKYNLLFWGIKIFSAIIQVGLSLIFQVNVSGSENQEIITLLTNSAPLLMLIDSTFLAPIVEEGIFRLGLRKVISNNYVFCVMSALIFGFMHIFPTDVPLLEAFISALPYVTMGALLAYIYVKTDNIWYTIIVHAINNLIGILLLIAIA